MYKMTEVKRWMFVVANEYAEQIKNELTTENIKRTMVLDHETLFIVNCTEEKINMIKQKFNITLLNGDMQFKMVV